MFINDSGSEGRPAARLLPKGCLKRVPSSRQAIIVARFYSTVWEEIELKILYITENPDNKNLESYQ